MTNREKANLLKDTIYQLYSKEGRSKAYISRLLEIDRKILSEEIKNWGFEECSTKKRLTPSMEKFINKNREFIKSKLDKGFPITYIAKELGVDRKKIYDTFKYDKVLEQAHEEMRNRIKTDAILKKEKLMENSKFDYDFKDLDGEIWKSILGWDTYFVSNKGRIKRYVKTYDAYHLIQLSPNKNNGRLYASLNEGDKRKSLQVSRLVGFAFLSDFYSEEKNTINHKDGNVANNNVENLEWVSQAENNLHAYQKLNRSIVNKRRYNFSKIIYKDKYEFNTVAAFAKFLGKSETQTRRYMDEPEKYDIKFV